MEGTLELPEENCESSVNIEKEISMDVSPGSPKFATGDPYRAGQRQVKIKKRDFVESDLKRRLELVETELEKSRNEVKKLKKELDKATQERTEILSTVSSLHVQVQYWNSWLGNFSQRVNNKSIKSTGTEESTETDLSESSGGITAKENLNEVAIACKDNTNCDTGSIVAKVAIGNSVNDNTNGARKHDTEEPYSVADMLKETAETAFADSGMAYDESSGLYYDWNSHMYYDPTTHLFYDNDNGIYYYYDHTKKSYVFYSQVNVKPADETTELSPVCAEGKSEGEISSSEDETEPEMVSCIRAIVTAADAVKVGTLYLVTCNGTTIGRDKKYTFYVPDKDVSKVHAVIKYEEKEGRYFIKDDRSVNGTFLNDRRLSESKTESKWFPIKHKDFLKLGSTVFVLHVHRGQETCDDCEPGQVQALLSAVDSENLQAKYASLPKEEIRKKQLRGLKEKYMVSGDGLKQALKPIISGKYKDRANKRRKNIGSEPIKDNLQHQRKEKSSIVKSISTENKGHQMMQKMGWKVGQGLGKESSGIREPINVLVREKNKGLGSGSLHSIEDSPNQKNANQKWKKAKERYDNIIQDEKDLNYETQIAENSNFNF